jgi:hypothetical protein
VDRRNLIVPIINCMAQNITGGNNATASVAAFGTFFLTQPFQADPNGYLFGEMTGLVGSNTNVQKAYQVQLSAPFAALPGQDHPPASPLLISDR